MLPALPTGVIGRREQLFEGGLVISLARGQLRGHRAAAIAAQAVDRGEAGDAEQPA